MATITYIPGSQLVLSIIGSLRTRNFYDPCPDLDKEVHVIIPAKDEESRIAYALGSVLRQDYQRLRVTVVNNLSSDRTFEVAEAMVNTFPPEYEGKILDNPVPGKTPSIKMAMKERPGSELTCILDADTYLTDSNYISALAAQFQEPKVGSSYGKVKPITPSSAKVAYENFVVQGVFKYLRKIMAETKPKLNLAELEGLDLIVQSSKPNTKLRLIDRIVIAHRRSLYSFDQDFIKPGQMGFYDTTVFPIGCGVMYDTTLLNDVFSDYETTMGDDLTTSEDIFLGFAIRDRGRKNVHVPYAHMESVEPTISGYFKQNHLWASSFTQSAFYFPDHTFRMFSRNGESEKAMGAYILFPMIEKLTYPLVLGYFALSGELDIVAGAIALEMAAFVGVNLIFAEQGYRLQSLVDTVFAQPLRLTSVFSELYTTGVFMKDVITGNRKWRK